MEVPKFSVRPDIQAEMAYRYCQPNAGKHQAAQAYAWSYLAHAFWSIMMTTDKERWMQQEGLKGWAQEKVLLELDILLRRLQIAAARRKSRHLKKGRRGPQSMTHRPWHLSPDELLDSQLPPVKFFPPALGAAKPGERP